MRALAVVMTVMTTVTMTVIYVSSPVQSVAVGVRRVRMADFIEVTDMHGKHFRAN